MKKIKFSYFQFNSLNRNNLRHIDLFIKSFLILSLYLPLPSWSSLPYQTTCTEGQKERTEKFSSFQTEANYCFSCEANNSDSITDILSYQNISYHNTIPKECFLAVALRGNRIFSNRYDYCSSEDNRSSLKGQKFCINEDYITAIYESFKKMSACFNFDKTMQEDLFHLINHESGGILNARSESNARCLGQITKEYVEHINNIIRTANWKRPHPATFIWKDILKKCPDLERAQIKCDYIKNSAGERKCLLPTINCQATQNPDKCLLYTFFGQKKAFENILERFNSPSGFMGNKEFPQPKEFIPKEQTKARERYQNMLNLLPMRRKEMLVMKVTLKTGQKRTWVMWDDSEIYKNKLHTKIDWSQPTEIKKISFFENERDIRTMFTYWSHNGGVSLSRGGFTRRLERLKQDIARGSCAVGSEELRCQMRSRLEEGKKIPNSLALKYFEKDLYRTYGGEIVGQNRKLEVSKYVRNTIDSRSIVFDSSNEEYKNQILKHYEKSGIDESTANQFLKDTDKICPKSLDYE